jgi:hypothetical protein
VYMSRLSRSMNQEVSALVKEARTAMEEVRAGGRQGKGEVC